MMPQVPRRRDLRFAPTSIKAAAVVIYRKALITPVEDPAYRGDGVSSAFPLGKQHGEKRFIIGYHWRSNPGYWQ